MFADLARRKEGEKRKVSLKIHFLDAIASMDLLASWRKLEFHLVKLDQTWQ